MIRIEDFGKVKRGNGNNYFIDVGPDSLKGVLARFRASGAGRITAITGRDAGKGIELLYSFLSGPRAYNFRVILPRERPEAETVIDLYPGAGVMEREAHEMLGVRFRGNPNHENILLDEHSPRTPLLKGPLLSPKKEPEILKNHADKKGFSLPIGPLHPMYVEAENLMVTVDGEAITDVDVNVGYMHRGVEELMQRRTYEQNVFLAERVCGICSGCHSICYAMAVENLLGLELPKKAEYIRTIILELERLHSHLLYLGVVGYEMGLDTIFMLTWKDRELVQDMLEAISGNRVNYAMPNIGGVRRDIPQSLVPDCLRKLGYLTRRFRHYNDLFRTNSSMEKRLAGTGMVSRQLAMELCLVGPAARASGLELDIRKARPYAAYDDVEWNAVVKSGGDSMARVEVKALECIQSARILEQCFKRVGRIKSPLRASPGPLAPEGEGLAFVEAPRGELFYYIRGNGTERPERARIRTPSFINLTNCLRPALVGQKLADLPVVVSSFDPCFSCCDRITVMDQAKGTRKTLSGQDFRKETQGD